MNTSNLRNLALNSPFRNRVITATAATDVRNPLCGDTIHLEVAVHNHIITDVSFSSEGCLLSQAAISVLAQQIINTPLNCAASITVPMLQDILQISVGPTRQECIAIAHTGLQHILTRYR